MLTLDEIATLVGPWYGEGRISSRDFDRLKTQYLTDIEAPKGQCTTCSSFRTDVLHHFRYQLKTNNITIMKSTRKYLLHEDVAYLEIPGSSRLVVNEAADNDENRQRLTTELAERLMESDPEYKKFIVKNPDYEEPVKKASTTTDPGKKGPVKPGEPAKEPVKTPAKAAPRQRNRTKKADTPPATTEPGPVTPTGDTVSRETPDIENAKADAKATQSATGEGTPNQ